MYTLKSLCAYKKYLFLYKHENSIFLILKKIYTRVRSAMVQGLLSLGIHRKNFFFHSSPLKKNFLLKKNIFLKIFALDSAQRYTFSPLSETFELYIKMLSHKRAMYTLKSLCAYKKYLFLYIYMKVLFF